MAQMERGEIRGDADIRFWISLPSIQAEGRPRPNSSHVRKRTQAMHGNVLALCEVKD
jgi:hypothetical protein